MAPRRRDPKPYVAASDTRLTAEEAYLLADQVERWPGSYARVLVNGEPIGYRPYAPPPDNADT